MEPLRLASLALCLVAAACSGKDGGTSGGAGCIDFSTVSGSPSFSKDVIPIFQLSCGLSTACHAQKDSSNGCATQPPENCQQSLCLASPKACPMTAQDIAAAYKAIVNAPAKESTGKRVIPGDPADSFLQQKIEYETLTPATCAAISCGPPGCGVRMPQSGTSIAQSDIDTIAAWIKSGAPNN